MSEEPGPGATDGEPLAPVDARPDEIGPPPETGHAAVDASLRALAQVADAAPSDQIPAFQAVHRTLQETLASIDEG